MDEFFDLPTLIVIAVAVFVLFRLRSVLGTRTGHERPPMERRKPEAAGNDDTVVPIRPRGAGNPELRPQYSHNIGLDHHFNQFINQSAGLNRTKDFTFWYSYTPDSTRVNIDTISNLAHRENYYYSLSAQKKFKWYSFQTYGVVMYRSFSGTLVNQDVSSRTVQFYFNLNQEFYLPKDLKIMLWCGRGSGFHDGPQIYYPRSAVHLSVNKTFLDQKLSITLGVHDIFYMDYFRYATVLDNQTFYWHDRPDTRRVRIWINYRFGKMRFEQRIRNETDSRLNQDK